MSEKFFKGIESSMGSELIVYGSIASVIFGVVLLFVGIYLKKKNNQWWILSVLLGVATVFTNALQIIQ